MSREEAIELLKVMASPKHAQKYQVCIDGGITSGEMTTESSEFVKELVNYGMDKEEALDLLQHMSPKHASRYGGSIDGGVKSGEMATAASEFVKDLEKSGMSKDNAIERLRPSFASMRDCAKPRYW